MIGETGEIEVVPDPHLSKIKNTDNYTVAEMLIIIREVRGIQE